MQKEIRKNWFFNRPPHDVWEYLTKPELLELWLGETDFQPVKGHKFRFVSPYGNDSWCEVLEVRPFTQLSYTWQKKSAKDNTPFNSKIVWTLVPKANGTELQLVHSGFTTLEDVAGHENGWNACLVQLEALLKKNHYTTALEISAAPENVFNRIGEVSKWWSKDFEGSSTRLQDEFIICHPGRHYSRQQLVEVAPNEKIVWLVTDSKLDWLEKDTSEWTNTKMIFELIPNGDKTVLHFTHEGLVPGKECYARCSQGWNMVINDWLFNFITTGKTI